MNTKKVEWEKVGTADVDAGLCWIGDPCYIIKDKDEQRPKEFGKNWDDFCDTFYEKSGYHKEQSELLSKYFEMRREFAAKLGKSGFDLTSEEESEIDRQYRQWVRKQKRRTQAAQFNHDAGHA
jgi:hypothetical protein